MRICPNCQAAFADQEVFCPVCGQEVQLVADYVTVESQAHEARQNQKKEEKLREEERERAELLQQRIRQRRKHVLLFFCTLAAIAIAVLVGAYVRADRRQKASFEYQIEQAKVHKDSGEWSQAENYARQALQLSPDNEEAMLLASEVLLHNQADAEAEVLLLKLIDQHPDKIEAYRLLFDSYLEDERIEDIQTILRSCKEDAVKEAFADYLPEGPQFSVEEGTYNQDLEVEITTDREGVLHYTTDGTEPDGSSAVYTAPVRIEEGITTLKAILITKDHGFKSQTSAAVYQIQYDAPPAPVIDLVSGTYTIMHYVDNKGIMSASSDKEMSITITYPEGFTCHYSFDKKPTKDSPTYRRPIPMEKGEHIFYAVLESENGKLGTIASATYKYDIRVVTPTPIPTARPYYRPTTPTETPTPEPTETPAETPDATPSETPATPTDTPGTPAEGGGDTPAPTPSDGGGETPEPAPSEGGETPSEPTPAEGGGAAPEPAPPADPEPAPPAETPSGGSEPQPAPPADNGGGDAAAQEGGA